MVPESPSKTKILTFCVCHDSRILKLTITIFVVVLLVSVGSFHFRNLGFVQYSSYFTVAVDCGSTGTRVNVYEWKSEAGVKSKGDYLPVLLHSYPDNSTKGNDRSDGCKYHCMQTEPGLHSFVENASGVRASLEPLVRRAEKWVPPQRHKDTPIFVLATAGLRSLSEENARRVLEDVESVVKLHDFKYRKDWIRVLSGREEAYYGWISLNYHMGIFRNSSGLLTLGLLDLGGSSLQVVAEIRGSGTDDDDGVFKSNIGTFKHQMLAVSLPAFGLNEAFDRTVMMLSHTQSLRESDFGTLEVGHPCLASSYMQNYTCHGCFGLVSVDSKNLTSQTRENAFSSMYLVGEPNWEKCKGLARAAAINSSNSFDWSKQSNDSFCTGISSMSGGITLNSVGGVHSVARFHALSGFFAVYNLLNSNATTNLSKFWEEGQQLCSRSLAGLTNMPIKQKYADFLCFRVPYMVSLIENALCLDDKEIVFGPGDISWTLGAALVEGKDLWLGTTSRAKSTDFSLRLRGVLFSPYFLFLLLMLILFVVYHSQIKLPIPQRKVASLRTSLPSYIGLKHRPV